MKQYVTILFAFMAPVIAGAQFRVFQRGAKGPVKSIEKTIFINGVYEDGKWVVRDSNFYEQYLHLYGESGASISERVWLISNGKNRESSLEIEYQYNNNNLWRMVYHSYMEPERVVDVNWVDAREYNYVLDDSGNKCTWNYTILLGADGFIRRLKLRRASQKNDSVFTNIVTTYSYNDEQNVTGEQTQDLADHMTDTYRVEILEKDDHGNPLLTATINKNDTQPGKARLTCYRYTYY